MINAGNRMVGLPRDTHNEGMSLMNDPQVWTLIGSFTTITLGGMTLMTTLISRATTNAVDGLRGELNGLRGELNARFDTVDTKIEHLDRDVGMLMARARGDTSSG